MLQMEQALCWLILSVFEKARKIDLMVGSWDDSNALGSCCFCAFVCGFLAQRKRPAIFEAEIKIAYITRESYDYLCYIPENHMLSYVANFESKGQKYFSFLCRYLPSYLKLSLYVEIPQPTGIKSVRLYDIYSSFSIALMFASGCTITLRYLSVIAFTQ